MLVGRINEQHGADAEYNLGIMYEQGNGLARKGTEAASWYRKAAEQGSNTMQLWAGADAGRIALMT